VLRPAYEKAIEILKKARLGPLVFEESQVDELVGQITDEVLAHDAEMPRHNQQLIEPN
jgi:hypothetical protein